MAKECTECGGTGQVVADDKQPTGPDDDSSIETCGMCHGNGFVCNCGGAIVTIDSVDSCEDCDRHG